MTRDEAARLLAVMLAAWPNQAVPDPEGMIGAYALGLNDVPYSVAEAAVKREIKTATFLPTVAELRRTIAEEVLGLPSPEEALSEVRQALREIGSYRVHSWSCPAVAEAVRVIGWDTFRMAELDDPYLGRRFRDAYAGCRARALHAIDIQAHLEAGATMAELPPESAKEVPR